MIFKNLKIFDWKQFNNLNIDFHPQLTVLTGANGSGKTTILNILAKHFGWNLNELSTPVLNKSTGAFTFSFSLLKKLTFVPAYNSQGYIIGSLTYSSDTETQLIALDQPAAQYYVQIVNQQQVRGLNIPSHRPVFFYEPVVNISTQKRTKEHAYQLTFQNSVSKFQAQYGQSKSANFYIKETLLSWAIGGAGNEFIQPDNEIRDYYLGFQRILKVLLPKTLGFQSIAIRNYEIILETETGDFMLDAVSGGLSAIIDLGWQIYNFSKDSTEKVSVLIDEVENHLHATMQREILPNLIDAFPNIQFIVSTHSPLIIGSVKDSFVHAFRYDDSKKIYNEKLDLENKAKSATEILNEVLGVPFTMPIWVENSLNSIINKYAELELNQNIFNEMREDMKELGLENLMPLALDKTIQKRNDSNS
ncbi:OLD family endonuclease [Adhaeribacter arboris]|uniref:OLD family endonuclease n=1 Tax=Adhaeribacter arboris TaxID=2072846 RepID=A0A2T2YJU2_9BACT|nr:AAA family ATPase [Adhaeribacter arboris]PSR55770.1 OLD family endonuclease [Adhaeribacter arboris]